MSFNKLRHDDLHRVDDHPSKYMPQSCCCNGKEGCRRLQKRRIFALLGNAETGALFTGTPLQVSSTSELDPEGLDDSRVRTQERWKSEIVARVAKCIVLCSVG